MTTRIYISATPLDLSAERAAVKAWLGDSGHEPVDSYGADSRPVLASCLVDVESCDLFLLILGHHYGHRPPTGNPENLSITHLEFRHAGARGIPQIVLQRTAIPEVAHSDVHDPAEMAALTAFHEEVAQRVRPARFADQPALIAALRDGVANELRKLGLAPGALALREPLRRASRDLLNWRTTLPDGVWLERPEQEALRQRVLSTSESLTLVLGEPGCGKSALLARLGQALQAEGMPVLGIKADLLPEDVRTTQALMEYLALPVPVLAAVQALAELGPVLVLVDQLDALADLVVQHSARLRLRLNLIRDLDDIPNVHVVATCRVFEQRHDPSLRNIEADQLTLALPDWETVNAVLGAKGVQTGAWNPDMRDALRSPHALDMFLSLLSGSDEISLAHGFQGMLQTRWEQVLRSTDGTAKRRALLDLAERMAARETLWVPLAAFEEQLATLQALLADGLLSIEEGSGRVAFRHQTWYEFVRARSFIDAAGRLTETVLARQASLRIRPQLWHALVYLRRVAPDQYQNELRQLWAAALRPHLRMLLIEFLGTQALPLGEELRLAWRNFDDPWFRRRFLATAVGSTGWFEALLPHHLPALMVQPASAAAVVLPILDRALASSTDAVLGLVDAHWLPHPDKDELSWRILAMGPLSPSDAAWVDRLERMAQRMKLAPWAITGAAGVVSAALPDEAARLFAAWLRQQWLAAQAEAVQAGADVSAQSAAPRERKLESLLEGRDLHNLTAIAEAAPVAFVRSVWPLFVEMLEAGAAGERPIALGYRENPMLLDDDLDDDADTHLERPLLEAVALAVAAWAEAQPDAFMDFLQANRDRNLQLVQRLLARGLARCAQALPATALEFLCADPRRLVLGPHSDTHRDSRTLIRALAPHLTDNEFRRLENAVMAWRRYRAVPDDDAETRRHRIHWERQHRLRLLRALPLERLSPATQRLVTEEERAFPELDDRDMWFSGAHCIGSPVSAEQMHKAKDEDILNLFAELTDDHNWDHPRQRMMGGAIQAGRELARLAESDPERAVRLVRALRPGRNETPVADVLEKLVGAGYAPDAFYSLIEELAAKGFASQQFRRACGYAIESAVSEEWPLPASLAALLESWLHPVDRASEDVVSTNAGQERKGSLLWGHGGSITHPAGNFPTLGALSWSCLIAKPPRSDQWLDILEAHLARTESPRVWAAIGWRYLRWLNLAEPARAQRFLDRLFATYPSLLGTMEGVHLLYFVHRWADADNLRRWLDDMARAGGQGAQGCGELLMLRRAQFPDEAATREQLEALLASSAVATGPQRVGIAYTLVRLWSDPNYRELAHGYLLPLLASSEDNVLQALGDMFRAASFAPDRATRSLFDALCEHPALLRDQRAEFLGEHLEALVAFEPASVARLANTLVDQAGEAMSGLGSSWYFGSEALLAVALALHDMEEPHRSAGADLFERMLEFNLPQANELALNLDKRTPNAAEGARPARRKRRTRR